MKTVLPSHGAPASGQQSDSAHTCSTCHNCGAETGGNFCSVCGQTTILHVPSAREFLHEFVGHYVALEGKLWRTLALLMFRPGALTTEYIAGRRVRYVEPLRVYLTFSILFFAIIKFGGGDLLQFDDREQAEAAAHVLTPGSTKDPHFQYQLLGRTVALPSQWQHFEKLPLPEKTKLVTDSFFHYAPYAMFCLMPLFALYLKILYIGSGRRYGEHFLFALHSNAFAFIAMASMALVAEGFFRSVLGAWLLAYLPWAMWRVYPSSKWGTICRWLALIVVYSITLVLASLASIAIGVLLKH